MALMTNDLEARVLQTWAEMHICRASCNPSSKMIQQTIPKGESVTDLYLTCLKDRKAASTEKSIALLAVSPHVSSNSG